MKSFFTAPLGKLLLHTELTDALKETLYNEALPYNFIRRLQSKLHTFLIAPLRGELWGTISTDFTPDLAKKARPSRPGITRS
jgi:hypothetical protein